MSSARDSDYRPGYQPDVQPPVRSQPDWTNDADRLSKPAHTGSLAWLASWFTDRQYRFDLLTGAGLVMVFLVFSAEPDSAWLVGILMALPWITRRRYPFLTLTLAVFAAGAHLALLNRPTIAIAAVPMYIYSFARWSDRGLSRPALAIALVGSILGPLRWLILPDVAVRAIPVGVITALACAGLVGVAYVAGRRRREQVERAEQAVAARIERARLVAAEQEQRARVAAVDERTRIARELHDIVAHSLSVIVVQAEGGRALAVKQPEKAPEVLGTIAETSREALEEMRQMVGLLRSGGSIGDPATPGASAESFLPTPGLADLEDLVAKTGDRVTLTCYGSQPAVSQPLGLTVYRIVQESLTNVLKHAGSSARAAVGITYAEHGIGIRVVDDGPGASAATAGEKPTPGHGLRGMRERVGLHNGTLHAGALPTGGFQVLAWLPYPPSPSPYDSTRRLQL